MRTDGNLGPTTSYNPNSQGLWDNQPEYAELPLALEGDADHYDHRLVDDHWEQPGNLFRKMTPQQKQLLFDNTARAINGASKEVHDRHIGNCSKADPTYGEGVAKAIAALQQQSYRSLSATNGSIASRTEGVHEQVSR
jgi:catalase